jgi:hypothetical protein
VSRVPCARYLRLYFKHLTKKHSHTHTQQGKLCSALHEIGPTITGEARQQNVARFGPNQMRVPTPSVLELVMDEVLSPFYIFQVSRYMID